MPLIGGMPSTFQIYAQNFNDNVASSDHATNQARIERDAQKLFLKRDAKDLVPLSAAQQSATVHAPTMNQKI